MGKLVCPWRFCIGTRQKTPDEALVAFIGAIFLIAPGVLSARGAEPVRDPQQNVALNKPYTFSQPPSYKLCSDDGDRTQLTDGKTHGSDWRAKSTVGWSREQTGPFVVIDLGATHPIDEVRAHSVGGGKANVFYPANIVLLVSDDNITFRLISAADNLGLTQNRVDPIAARVVPHVFRMGDLATRGRYVLVLLDYDGDHLFIDEIEVLRGTHDADSVTFDGDNAFSLENARSSLRLAREFSVSRFALERWEESVRTSQPQTIETIETLRRALHRVAMHELDDLRAFQDRIGAARGRWLGKSTGRRLVWERVNPMRQPRLFNLPSRAGALGSDGTRRVDVSMWRREYESAAISLFNCGETPLTIRTTLTPLRAPTGELLPAHDTITLRHAVFVDARGEGRIGDALVKIPEGGFRVDPGRTGQLWLTFHNPELAPGTYHFAVDMELHDRSRASDPTHEMIQGSLTVQPAQFPVKPTLNSYAWAFVERSDLTHDVQQEAIADLRAHYINTDVLFWSRCLPMPRMNPNGGVDIRLDELVAALERYKDNDQYMFFWGLGRFRKNVPNMPKVRTPEWEHAIKDWLTQWVGFLKDRGLRYDHFIMYPFDEMLPDEFETLARFIKEKVDPKIRLFANSRGDKNGNEMTRLAPYIDIWCFRDIPYGARISAAEQRVRQGNAEVWCYECARPAKGKPPSGYYRLQAWRAFDRGETGSGFWTYTDPGEGNGDAWNDFESRHGKYGVIYGPIGKPPRVDLSGERIVPSRRWEAWREGIEDYEYLSLLKRAIDSAEADGRRIEAAQARAVLEEAIKNVLENPQNPDVVYDARRAVSNALMSLLHPGHSDADDS